MTETKPSADQDAAVQRAADTDLNHYIVVPASPWGGKTATFGPMTESEARERLAVYLPLYLPECPPKLLRLMEDYGELAHDGEDVTFREDDTPAAPLNDWEF